MVSKIFLSKAVQLCSIQRHSVFTELISIYVCHNVCTNWQLLLSTPLNLCIDKAAFWLLQNSRGHLKHNHCGLWMRQNGQMHVVFVLGFCTILGFPSLTSVFTDLCTCFRWLDIVLVLPPKYDTSTLHVTFGLLLAIGGGDNRKISPNWRSQVFIRGSYYERERKKEVTNEWGKILLMMSLLIMCQSCASCKRTVIFVTVFYTNTTRFQVHVYTW